MTNTRISFDTVIGFLTGVALCCTIAILISVSTDGRPEMYSYPDRQQECVVDHQLNIIIRCFAKEPANP